MEDRIVFCLNFSAWAILLMPLVGIFMLLWRSDINNQELSIKLEISPVMIVAFGWLLAGWIT